MTAHEFIDKTSASDEEWQKRIAPFDANRRCTRVLHIDWDGDPDSVREIVGQCLLNLPHEGKQHETKDSRGDWFRW